MLTKLASLLEAAGKTDDALLRFVVGASREDSQNLKWFYRVARANSKQPIEITDGPTEVTTLEALKGLTRGYTKSGGVTLDQLLPHLRGATSLGPWLKVLCGHPSWLPSELLANYLWGDAAFSLPLASSTEVPTISIIQPLIAQPVVNGVRAVALYQDGSWTFIDKLGRVLPNCQVISQHLLSTLIPTEICIDGVVLYSATDNLPVFAPGEIVEFVAYDCVDRKIWEDRADSPGTLHRLRDLTFYLSMLLDPKAKGKARFVIPTALDCIYLAKYLALNDDDDLTAFRKQLLRVGFNKVLLKPKGSPYPYGDAKEWKNVATKKV